MVRLMFKKENEGLFIMETTLEKDVETILEYVLQVQNGRLKIERLCYEIGELAKHGISLPPNMQGLTDEQVSELKLVNEWEQKCVPSGGVKYNKDEIGRRCGQAPLENMQKVLNDTTEEAKQKVSKKHFENNKPVTNEDVKDSLYILSGAVTIVYPMGLPPHDPIKAEFDGTEDLSGTQMAKEVLEASNLSLWYCGKEMQPLDKPLSHFLGKNEKTTVIIKLSKKGHGCPAREPVVSEAEQKLMMAHAYRRQEELKINVLFVFMFGPFPPDYGEIEGKKMHSNSVQSEFVTDLDEENQIGRKNRIIKLISKVKTDSTNNLKERMCKIL